MLFQVQTVSILMKKILLKYCIRLTLYHEFDVDAFDKLYKQTKTRTFYTLTI